MSQKGTAGNEQAKETPISNCFALTIWRGSAENDPCIATKKDHERKDEHENVKPGQPPVPAFAKRRSSCSPSTSQVPEAASK